MNSINLRWPIKKLLEEVIAQVSVQHLIHNSSFLSLTILHQKSRIVIFHCDFLLGSIYMCSISLNKAGKIKTKSLKIAYSLCSGPPSLWCSNFSGHCSAPCSIWYRRKDLIWKDVLWNEYWRTTQYLCDQGVVIIFIFKLLSCVR